MIIFFLTTEMLSDIFINHIKITSIIKIIIYLKNNYNEINVAFYFDYLIICRVDFNQTKEYYY